MKLKFAKHDPNGDDGGIAPADPNKPTSDPEPKAQDVALADLLFPEEEPEEESILDVPPEQRKLHTETYDFSVSTLIEYLQRDHVRIPEFQRRYVWNDAQASRLIESLVIQCPIPVLYLSQNVDETFSVIDGNQRLTSLRRFLEDGFALRGLTAYPELTGKRFSELDSRIRRHIQNRTLRCIVILKDTHPQVKFDVFERLNTGSVQLSAQELRHGIYHGRLMECLDRITKDATWKKAIKPRKNSRMKEQELALRFLALKNDLANYHKPLAAFLNQYAEKERNAPEETITSYYSDAITAVDAVLHLFGELAFRLYTKQLEVTGSLNAALFDAEMIAASERAAEVKALSRRDCKRFQRYLHDELLRDGRFFQSVTRATSDEASVQYRISTMRRLLDTTLTE